MAKAAYLAFLVFSFPTYALAEELIFTCEWRVTNDSNYITEFSLDTTTLFVSRSDSGSEYSVIKLTEDALWLSVDTGNSLVQIVQTIERSPVGGTWTDTWMWADGSANPTKGGYCVESTK